MTAFGDRASVAAKIDWEGGVYEALDWGMTDEDMPDDELRLAWHEMADAFAVAEEKRQAVENLITPHQIGSEDHV